MTPTEMTDKSATEKFCEECDALMLGINELAVNIVPLKLFDALEKAVQMIREMDACWNIYEKQAGRAADEMEKLQAQLASRDEVLKECEQWFSDFVLINEDIGGVKALFAKIRAITEAGK